MKTAFLSSTAKDLAEYRDAAYNAIEGLDDWHCRRMEDFGARDKMADEFCQEKVAESDVFVGIVGHCYGSNPKGSEESYTEQEYDAAIATEKPRLMFLAPEEFLLPAYLIEPDERRAKQRAFRDRANAERIRDTFTSPEDLAWRVLRAVRNWETAVARAIRDASVDLLHTLLMSRPVGEAVTMGFRHLRHSELVSGIHHYIDRYIGEEAQIMVLQSLADASCDIAVYFRNSGPRYGIQVKSDGDIGRPNFAVKTLAQVQDSRRHNLQRLYLLLCADLTNKAHCERARQMVSRISQMNDPYVYVVPPERAWAVWSAAEPKLVREPLISELGPLPVQPYFAHPYALQPNFTGRAYERRELTEWFTSDAHPMFAYIAIGGMGKSALAWAWLQRDVLGLPLPGVAEEARAEHAAPVPEASRPEGVLWWSFYERESTFQQFLDEALTYASDGKVDPKTILSIREKMLALHNLLCQNHFLLVLDGVERLLRAYARPDAAYRGDEFEKDERGDFQLCADPNAGLFLQWMASGAMKSKVLLTSRLFPRELDGLAGCRRAHLAAFDPEDAVIFFHAQGVKGTRSEIQATCAPYGYLPLALRLLSGLIVRDKRTPGDIQVASRYPVLPELKGSEQHHVLEVAYNALDEKKRELLSRISAFRSPITYEALSVFDTYKSKGQFDAALDELIDRDLLLFGRERGRYDLHPIVRGYAYDRLADKAGTHTRLGDYFAAVPTPEADQVQSLDDLAPVIELYRHTVGAGRYDEAMRLYRDRLAHSLYFRFGTYQTCIELLRALFPDGEDKPPRLKDESAQAWTLNELAGSYALSGQPRRTLPLVERNIAIREKQGKKDSIAVILRNLATQQIILGELAATEQSLRRMIKLCREIEDERREAIGHRDLGRLLGHSGKFADAANELDSSIKIFIKREAIDIRANRQGQGIIWAYRALHALLKGDSEGGLNAARRARELADVALFERDIIRAEWLLGAAHRALGHLSEAERHLTDALTRCRRINLVELEPDILIEMVRLRWAQAQGKQVTSEESTRLQEEALGLAREALAIADRCEYRLKQADIHNFLAQVALEKGDHKEAWKHAEIAKERAWCDGPPHCYKPALEEAERLLESCGGE